MGILTSKGPKKAASQILHLWGFTFLCTLMTCLTRICLWLKALEHSMHCKSVNFSWTDFTWRCKHDFCTPTKVHSLQAKFLTAKCTILMCAFRSKDSEHEKSHRRLVAQGVLRPVARVYETRLWSLFHVSS